MNAFIILLFCLAMLFWFGNWSVALDAWIEGRRTGRTKSFSMFPFIPQVLVALTALTQAFAEKNVIPEFVLWTTAIVEATVLFFFLWGWGKLTKKTEA